MSDMITGLGHVGLHTFDLVKMKDFYTRVMGLHVTDEDQDFGVVFLSADPDAEHHELALFKGRDVTEGATLVNQISFKVSSLDALKEIYQRVKAEQLPMQRFVNHGISLGLYLFDPEGNRLEVYYKTGFKVPQPLADPVDIEASNEELLDAARAMIPAGASPSSPPGSPERGGATPSRSA